MSPVSGNTYFFHYVVVLSDALGDAHLEATQHDCNETEALFSKMDTDERTRFRYLRASTGAADHIKDLAGFLTGGCLVENRLKMRTPTMPRTPPPSYVEPPASISL